MSLLRDIQEAAISSEIPVTALLRKAKVLAARLKSSELSAWIDLELNGYPDKEGLPEYRVILTRAVGHFTGSFGSALRNAPIPPACIPEEFRDWARKSYLVLPISAYEDLLRNQDAGSFQGPWPADLIAHVAGNIYEGMNLLGAWTEIPRGSIVSAVDGVRNRILNFALTIEGDAPDAGEAPAGAAPLPPDRVAYIFHTQIHGNVGNYAAGQSVSQNVETQVIAGDLASMRESLKGLGVAQEDITDLEKAVAEDGKPTGGFGKRVSAWVGSMLGKAAAGVWKVSLDTASATLPRVLARFYGLPLP